MSFTLKPADVPAARPDARRWTALGFIALAQLMAALDATIVSIALPSAQRALAASDAERQWVITAYTLAFGGLLLLGGRIADTVGRKRAFVLGLAGFAIASAVGGSAPSVEVLRVVLATGGLVALVYACTQAVSAGWGAQEVILLLVASSALLILFVVRETRTSEPLLPLRIVLDRNRGGAYLAVALAIASMFRAVLVLTYYFQVPVRHTPLQ